MSAEAEWLSVTEYAQVYGVDRSTVYKWIANGVLVTYKVDKLRRIRNLPPDQHQPTGEKSLGV